MLRTTAMGLGDGLRTRAARSGANSGAPVLNLDFVSMTALGLLDSRLTFSRASNATMFDSQGRMVWAPANMVGDSVNLANPGFWNGTSGVVVASVEANPFGGGEVFRFRANAGGAASYAGLLRSFAFPFAAGARYVFSVFLKADTASVVGLRIGQSVSASDRYCHFNLSSGVATAITPVEGTVNAVSMTPAGNGWWRCVLDWTAGIPTASTVLDICVSSAPDGNSAGPYAGTEAIFVYGPMVERWSVGGPRPYIRSAGAAFYSPRFDTNPLTLQPRGLQVESSATNILPCSSERIRASGGWADANTTSNLSSTPDLTGNSFFTEIFPTSAPNGCRIQTVNLKSVTPGSGWVTGQLMTATVFMRRGAGNGDGYIMFDDGGGTVYACCRATLTGAGAIEVTGLRASRVGSIERITNDVYRVRVSFALDTVTDGTVRTSIGVWNDNSYTSNYPVCNSLSTSVLAWGVQVEATGFPTSYIPKWTTDNTGQPTRVRDECFGATTGWYSAPVGTLNIEAEYVYTLQSGYFPTAASVRNTGNNHRANLIRVQQFDTLGVELIGAVADAIYPGTAPGVQRAVVAADGVGQPAFSANGTAASLGTNLAVMPGGANELTVGAQGGGETVAWNGWVRRIRFWRSRLPNADLQALTA